MSNKLAVQRLLREQQKMQKQPNDHFIVIPSSDNIFEWHFVLYNFSNSPYSGGQYHGKLLIPAEYPMKPPTLIFVTPQGRFKPGEKICLSFTSFHPESWSTSWTIESMLVGLISFMHSNEATTGGVNTTDDVKRRLAKQSIRFNLDNPQFEKIFKSYFDKLGIEKGEQILNPNHNIDERKTTTSIKQNDTQNEQVDDEQQLNIRKLLFFATAFILLAGFYLYIKAKK